MFLHDRARQVPHAASSFELKNVKKIWKCFFLKTRIEYKNVCVWERDGSGWTDPQWWCQRADSGCLGCHNVAVSLQDITHINSLSHTHTLAVFRTSHRRGAREVWVLPPSYPNHPSNWHGLRAMQAWERHRPAGSNTHSHTRMPDQSSPCQLHMFTLASVTHTLKCVRLCLLLAGASKLPSETQKLPTDELFT